MSNPILFQCTYGAEDPERATLPFVAANAAATAGQHAIVVCTLEAVWLGTINGATGVEARGLPLLGDLVREFVNNGGGIWLCGASTRSRGITPDCLAPGACIVGEARIVEAVAAGSRTVALV